MSASERKSNMIYSKTLQSSTYDIAEVSHLHATRQALTNIPYRFDHPHRAWEYGLMLSALVLNKAKTVLEIGGAGSLFAPAATLLGMNVTQVDLQNCSHWTAAQEKRLNIFLPYVQRDFFEYTTDEKFDAVVSISVIEHAPADKRTLFFEKMLTFVNPGGLVAITTDFYPSGGRSDMFNDAEMLALYDVAHNKGFDWFGNGYDYTYAGEFVNFYTFASLVLRREK